MTQPAKERQEEAERLALQAQLWAKGILAIYGGGSKSKGHGFWLYRACVEALERYHATNGWTHLDDVESIQNDGIASGNPSFHLFPDAQAYA